MPTGVAKVRQAVVEQLESAQAKLTPLSQAMLWRLGQACATLAEHIAAYQEPRAPRAARHPERQRLRTLPGLGPLPARR